MGPIKILFYNSLIRQNVIQVRITPVLQCHGTNQSSAKYQSNPAECNTSTHKFLSTSAIGPMKVVLDNCLVQQNVIQVHITPIVHMPRDQS